MVAESGQPKITMIGKTINESFNKMPFHMKCELKLNFKLEFKPIQI